MATKQLTKTNNVVQNNNTASVGYSREVFDTLAAINQQRERWEVGAYQKSSDELYAILQSCYAVDWAIANTEEGANEMRKGVTEYAAKLGFSFKEGTPTMNKIVRCVFGNVKRSRISTYALVLREAKKQSVPIDDIAQFIANGGGVQGGAIDLSHPQTPGHQCLYFPAESAGRASVGARDDSGCCDARSIGPLTGAAAGWRRGADRRL